ncbi:MAG: UbiA family prenyltransferase [Candidatus Hadarchaeota archaeon]
MLFMAVLIGAFIAEQGIPPADRLFFAFLTPMFLEASTFALNDYFDYEMDKKNKRTDRPLVRGDLDRNTALYVFVILFPFGILSSYFVNWTCFLIALFTGALSVLYDGWMKRVKLLGNFYIAYIMAVPFIFGATAVSPDLSSIVLFMASIAFLTGVGREIMKDIMDFKGDKELGVKSFPSLIGLKKSRVTSAFFYIAAVFLSFIPFFYGIDGVYYMNYAYFGLVLVTDAMLLYTSLVLFFGEGIDMKFQRKFTLLAIFIGLLAFLIGVIVA